MVFCHSCGVEIDEKDRYCHSCGAELGQYTGVDVQSSNEVRDNDPVNPTPNSSSEQHPEKDEVKRMVAESPGTSLTQELLLDTGEVGFASPAYLNEAPLVKYLDEDETVQYLLWNNTKGVRFESQSDITPSEDYRTMVAVTDHRLLIVVGCEEENKEHSIPYDTILEIDLSTSFTKDRLTITSEEDTINIPISFESVSGEDEYEEIVSFVNHQITNPDTPFVHKSDTPSTPQQESQGDSEQALWALSVIALIIGRSGQSYELIPESIGWIIIGLGALFSISAITIRISGYLNIL